MKLYQEIRILNKVRRRIKMVDSYEQKFWICWECGKHHNSQIEGDLCCSQNINKASLEVEDGKA